MLLSYEILLKSSLASSALAINMPKISQNFTKTYRFSFCAYGAPTNGHHVKVLVVLPISGKISAGAMDRASV